MKAKTILEQTIVNLHGKLKPTSQNQLNWGFAHCFKPTGTINKNTIHCLECGHHWKDSQGIILLVKIDQICHCPNCNQVIEILPTSKRKIEFQSYYSIITRFKNLQIIRYLELKKCYQTKNPAKQFSSEVMQHWIDQNGKITYLAKSCNQNPYYYDIWKTSSDLHIAKANSYRSKSRLSIVPNKIYPFKNILPIIKRNGFKGEFYNYLPTLFFSRLIKNPIFETLLKCNRMDFVKSMPFDIVETLWPQIKIAIKYNYYPKNYSDWTDLIRLLKQFNKDIFSVKYICPSDLNQEHQRLVNKRRKLIEKQQFQEQIKLIDLSDKTFIPQKKKYFSINFQNPTLKVIVLKSVREFFNESQLLNHCLFSNKYYQKENSLILSARNKDNQPIETIEFSLITFEIIQSRGLNNLPTKFNNEIIELVNQNISQIKKIHFKKEPA